MDSGELSADRWQEGAARAYLAADMDVDMRVFEVGLHASLNVAVLRRQKHALTPIDVLVHSMMHTHDEPGKHARGASYSEAARSDRSR